MAIYESETIEAFSFEESAFDGSIIAIFHKHAHVPGPNVTLTLEQMEERSDKLIGADVWGDVTAQALPRLRELNGFPSGQDSRKIKPS